MNAPASKRIQLQFENLPLIEAAVRVTFAEEHGLTLDLGSQMIDRLKPGFTKLDLAPNIEAPPGISVNAVMASPAHMPLGLVLTGNETGISLKLQRQLIAARWELQLGGTPPPYPRYAALRDSLLNAIEAIRSCQTTSRIAVVNMLYVNFIKTESPDGQCVSSYLSEKVRPLAIANAERVQQALGAWRDQDGIDVRFDFRHATATIDDDAVDGFRLVTAAGIMLPEGADHVPHVDLVHDRLQVLFRDIISKDAKLEWGYSEATA